MTKRTFTGKGGETWEWEETPEVTEAIKNLHDKERQMRLAQEIQKLEAQAPDYGCLLYTSPSPRDAHESRMPSSA